MQKITPFLWYEDKAEEAANFYVSIFKGTTDNNPAQISTSEFSRIPNRIV